MPSTTDKGITYPVGSDRYAATPAFSTLATTTDQAIRGMEATVLSAARAEMTTIAGESEARVEDMIANSALSGMTDAEVQATVLRVLSSQAWKDRRAAVVHVADFGAVGDGKTDDTKAIQDALDTGRCVEFSRKNYVITAALTVPSGSVVRGNGAKFLSDRVLSAVFLVAGSPEAGDVNLSGAYNAGDTTLKTTTAHGLKQGEAFRLVGQRCAGSIDAPPEDRLGMSTSGNPYPWFGEYLKVRKVISDTEFTVSTGLIFNEYRPDKTKETMAEARERTTLNKMRWARDIVIEGFRVDLKCLYLIRADYAMDCVFRDIREVRRHDQGYAFGATGCFRVLVTDVHSEYPGDHPSDVKMYMRNTFKIMSSQNVVIDRCTTDGGSQIVDMSYQRASLIPTIACSVTRCTFWGYDKNAMTTHPGVWGAIIADNDFRAGNDGSAFVASGIAVRSPWSVIRNNVVHGSRSTTASTGGGTGNSGISAFDGGGHHLQITGNVLVGFDRGIAIMDGNEAAERHVTLYDQVTNNQIIDCLYGVLLWKSSLAGDMLALMISGNQITSKVAGATGVSIDENRGGPKGVTVAGNVFHFTGSDALPIKIGAAVNAVVMNNVATGTATRMYSTWGAVGYTIIDNVLVNSAGVTRYPEA